VILLLAAAVFSWQDLGLGSFLLTEDDRPVLMYQSEMRIGGGAPAEKRRCCYVHPVYAPNGAVVTDDFPADHWHHRGIFWAWPRVTFDGKTYDMWMHLNQIVRRTVSVKSSGSELVAENGWFLGERQIARENVSIKPTDDGKVDFTLQFEALAGPITLAGAPEQDKGYGGFSVRFAPRKDTVIRSDTGPKPKDTDHVRHKWAELSATYGKGPATLRIEDLTATNEWCVRNYGFLGVNFPGRTTYTLQPGMPLELKYRVSVTSK
jgi:hypothetical protein